jgi:hypothetical protein
MRVMLHILHFNKTHPGPSRFCGQSWSKIKREKKKSSDGFQLQINQKKLKQKEFSTFVFKILEASEGQIHKE